MLAAISEDPAAGDGGFTGQIGTLDDLVKIGTRVKLRRGQKLYEPRDEVKCRFLVCNGSLFLQSSLPERRSAIVATYYAGDLYAPAAHGRAPGEALISAEAATVIRFNPEVFAARATSDAAVASYYERSLQVRAARVEAHAIVVGRLTGEERVAAYLIEACRMRGDMRDNAVHVELPFSRDEVADYLALNPDSLSRLLSRLKAEGLVTFLGHRRVIVADWEKLLRRCPVADLLLAVFQR